MVSKRLISVDCDLTVCPSDQGWLDWLCAESRRIDCLPISCYGKDRHYNLGEYFPRIEDPFKYWRELDYFQFQPLEGSVEKLKALSQYFDICFISAHKGQHSKSKYYWLQEHFPFNCGVMLTKEKHLMSGSVICHIDDRLDMLDKFNHNQRVLFKTPYKQSVDCSVNMVIENWKDFSTEQFCKEYLK